MLRSCRPLMAGDPRRPRSQRHVLPRRRDLRRRQQHLGGRRRRRVRRDRRAALGRRILAVVGDRKVKAILLTHAHDDHCRVAPALREEVVAPIFLHPDDKPLWELTHTDHLWDLDLPTAGSSVGGTTLQTLHTPGHAPAAAASTPDLGCVFTGDTLFNGGPGATGRRAATAASRPRSGRSCSRCPTTRSCTPATARTPRSVRRGRPRPAVALEGPHQQAGPVAAPG